MASPVLTRDSIAAIKAVDDRAIESVEVPEWGFMLYVRGLTGEDRDAFEMAMIEQRKTKDRAGKRPTQEMNLKNLRAKLVVRCVVDSDDKDKAQQVFSLGDIEWLGQKSAQALQRVYVVAQRLSGLSSEDEEELTEALGEEPSDDSGTDSLSNSGTPPSSPYSGSSAASNSPNGQGSTDSSPSEVVA